MFSKLLSLFVCLSTGTCVWGQEIAATATFTTSEDGKTLTINGGGNLTTLTLQDDKRSFSDKASQNVSLNDNQYNLGNLGVYDATYSYYGFNYVLASILASELEGATVTYSWNKELQTLYHYAWADGDKWTEVNYNTDGVDTESKWIEGREYSNYATGADGTGRILMSDFKSGTYFTSSISGDNITYSGYSEYYRCKDGEYIKVNNGDTVNANDEFYSKNFGTLTEEQMIDLGYLETKTLSFAQRLAEVITKGAAHDNVRATTLDSYETVSFVNNTPGEKLTIDKSIVHSILFPATESFTGTNTSIKTLNLGAAYIEDLDRSVFESDGEQPYPGQMVTLTLPLTKLTGADGVTTGESDREMVVTSELFYNYNYNIPLRTVIIPEGYSRIGDNAFYGSSSITSFKLPSSLTAIGTSAFENCGGLESIALNDGLKVIGKRAFVNTKLNGITFPSSLERIDDAAFAGVTGIAELKFNENLKFIGNSAFGLSSEKTYETIEIPASVRYIGPHAFRFRQYQDVYFYGENAPLMPMGKSVYAKDWFDKGTAFSAHTLMGNDGFNNGINNIPSDEKMYDDACRGYANRENYKNHNFYFCVLHFPSELIAEQAEQYTDITRVYKTNRTQNGKFYYARTDDSDTYEKIGQETETLTFSNGSTALTASQEVCYGYEDTYLGSQYIWPSQEQWGRSYVVNSNGYKWDGVTPYRSTLSDEDKAILAYEGYVIGNGEGEYTEDELQKIAHMGTRQFVLVNADVKSVREGKKPVYPVSMKGHNWWTICVPFSMTKAQVDKVFGKGTHVCLFSSVSRTENTATHTKNITLRFQEDVYATKWVRDQQTYKYTKAEGAPADDDIVIYSHEPYMIFPTKSNEDAVEMYNIEDYKLETGSPMPTIIRANADDTSEDADHTEYRFVGNYISKTAPRDGSDGDVRAVTIPQYSYVYAKKKSATNYQFWFYTGTQSAWAANKCVVQATAKDGGSQDFKNFFGGETGTSKVMQHSLFGDSSESGDITGVENITIIAGEGKDAQRVYNLNGQMVGNSLNGLGKGIYIKNGKKIMVSK